MNDIQTEHLDEEASEREREREREKKKEGEKVERGRQRDRRQQKRDCIGTWTLTMEDREPLAVVNSANSDQVECK